MEGKIKWYKRDKGYGFIVGDDGKDYFVHYTALPQDQQDVREQDNIEVTFELKEGRDGRPQADTVVFKSGSNEESEESESEA